MALNETHDPRLRSWVASANDPDSDFPLQNLPFGIFRAGERQMRPGVAVWPLERRSSIWTWLAAAVCSALMRAGR